VAFKLKGSGLIERAADDFISGLLLYGDAFSGYHRLGQRMNSFLYYWPSTGTDSPGRTSSKIVDLNFLDRDFPFLCPLRRTLDRRGWSFISLRMASEVRPRVSPPGYLPRMMKAVSQSAAS